MAETTKEYSISQPENNIKSEKNPAAVALGRLGDLKGGKGARAENLSPKRRKEIAQIF